MAPVVWFLVSHADGKVSTEYGVWEGWTRESILTALLQLDALPYMSFQRRLLAQGKQGQWKDFAILRVDKDEEYTLPF
jgi:hypothetical protein